MVGKRRNDNICRLYTTSGQVGENFDEFELPKGGAENLIPRKLAWANYIMGVMAHYPGTVQGFDVVITSTVPVGGGVSSSAALEVATHTFLEALEGHTSSDTTMEKVLTCQKAENTFANMPCGIMDQYISVKARKGCALLLDCRTLEYTHVPMNDPSVKIVVINSHVKHNLANSEYPLRLAQCEEAAKVLGIPKLRDATMADLAAAQSVMDPVVYKRARHVITENLRCQEAGEALKTGDFEKFGKLMIQSYNSLRDDFEVSCPEIDNLVTLALEVDGVYGSRMTGGGFGGCTVSLVKTTAIQTLVDHIKANYKGQSSIYVVNPSGGARICTIANQQPLHNEQLMHNKQANCANP